MNIWIVSLVQMNFKTNYAFGDLLRYVTVFKIRLLGCKKSVSYKILFRGIYIYIYIYIYV